MRRSADVGLLCFLQWRVEIDGGEGFDRKFC